MSEHIFSDPNEFKSKDQQIAAPQKDEAKEAGELIAGLAGDELTFQDFRGAESILKIQRAGLEKQAAEAKKQKQSQVDRAEEASKILYKIYRFLADTSIAKVPDKVSSSGQKLSDFVGNVKRNKPWTENEFEDTVATDLSELVTFLQNSDIKYKNNQVEAEQELNRLLAQMLQKAAPQESNAPDSGQAAQAGVEVYSNPKLQALSEVKLNTQQIEALDSALAKSRKKFEVQEKELEKLSKKAAEIISALQKIPAYEAMQKIIENFKEVSEKKIPNEHMASPYGWAKNRLDNLITEAIPQVVKSLEAVGNLALINELITKSGLEDISPALGAPEGDGQYSILELVPHIPGKTLPNTIQRVVQRGYRYEGKIISKPMVIVQK